LLGTSSLAQSSKMGFREVARHSQNPMGAPASGSPSGSPGPSFLYI
jgi:hypothetical protein